MNAGAGVSGIGTAAGVTGVGSGSLACFVIGVATALAGAGAVAVRVGVGAAAGGGMEMLEGAPAETEPVSRLTRRGGAVLPVKNSAADREGSMEGAGGKMSDWKLSACARPSVSYCFLRIKW